MRLDAVASAARACAWTNVAESRVRRRGRRAAVEREGGYMTVHEPWLEEGA